MVLGSAKGLRFWPCKVQDPPTTRGRYRQDCEAKCGGQAQVSMAVAKAGGVEEGGGLEGGGWWRYVF